VRKTKASIETDSASPAISVKATKATKAAKPVKPPIEVAPKPVAAAPVRRSRKSATAVVEGK
jgi:hypothetical protein